MSLIVWIIFGALVGWLASIIAGTNNQQGALANIVVGIIPDVPSRPKRSHRVQFVQRTCGHSGCSSPADDLPCRYR
jgi:hypothetical protein